MLAFEPFSISAALYTPRTKSYLMEWEYLYLVLQQGSPASFSSSRESHGVARGRGNVFECIDYNTMPGENHY